ncbi:taste receptor type 2 member 42-like [Hippopotamus amphibius kiboko]|uniref:taste receptor type 2 member 42-like n=1 Tax=Hippopotamus amphibius kiboko TaxID=575201 RepID=UPI00259A2B6C|nr:taste receptor type 2 member 42-like [Hippopotamus amphibius kiboko]
MKVFFLVVATGELVLVVLGNGFIGLANCIEWVKKGKVSSADFILTCLAVARIIQLWVALLDSLIVELAPHLYATGKLTKLVTLLWTLTNHLTTWFATCLSMFYFLKIARFSHFFFIWLKWRMNRVVFVLFLSSFFLLYVDLLMQDALGELWISIYREHERNTTLHLDASKIFYLKSLIILSLIYIIPFLLSLASLLLLFLSLVRHTKNFQLNLNGSEDSTTEAHKRAMKMVTPFLLLFIIYFISTLIGSWIVLKVQWYQAMTLVMVISNVFPSGHSYVIILGNSKLRQMALRLPWHLKFSKRKSKPLA